MSGKIPVFWREGGGELALLSGELFPTPTDGFSFF
jgi:hypothetical protein